MKNKFDTTYLVSCKLCLKLEIEKLQHEFLNANYSYEK